VIGKTEQLGLLAKHASRFAETFAMHDGAQLDDLVGEADLFAALGAVVGVGDVRADVARLAGEVLAGAMPLLAANDHQIAVEVGAARLGRRLAAAGAQLLLIADPRRRRALAVQSQTRTMTIASHTSQFVHIHINRKHVMSERFRDAQANNAHSQLIAALNDLVNNVCDRRIALATHLGLIAGPRRRRALTIQSQTSTMATTSNHKLFSVANSILAENDCLVCLQFIATLNHFLLTNESFTTFTTHLLVGNFYTLKLAVAPKKNLILQSCCRPNVQVRDPDPNLCTNDAYEKVCDQTIVLIARHWYARHDCFIPHVAANNHNTTISIHAFTDRFSTSATCFIITR
jgi:hypothetical protein